jgi:type I restriction enzyme, S subunit
MSDLPEGWVHELLSTLAQWGSGGTPSRNNLAYYGGNIPWIKTGELGQGIITDTEEKITELGLQNSSAKIFPKGSVAVAMYGATIGKTAILDIDAATNQACAVGIPVEGLTTKEYLFYYLTSQKDAFVKAGQGGAQPNISQTVIKNWPVPLAPLNEQKQIADKLDRLLAKVDACRERCDRIPLILKRFRQSVLAAAISGELTEDWREEISVSGEFNSLYGSLPAGWEWKLIREVGRVQLGRQRAPKYHSGKYMRPYLRVQNIFEDRIDLSDVMEMDFSPDDFERYQLHFGDILLNEGQSPVFLGRPAMYRDDLPGACFTNSLIRFRAFDTVNRDFALLVFRHYLHCGRFQKESTITTNIAHLSAGRFSNIEFPLPPLKEQQEIVRRVEKLFTFADRLESRYQAARAKCDRLTPALLEKAFQGELVPQDPNDEPASVLLEKIQSDQMQAEGNKTKRTAKGRKPKAQLD